MHPVKLLERAASTAVHAARHPISTVSYAAGIARGLAGVAVQGARSQGRSDAPTSVPTQNGPAEAADATAPIPEPQRVGKPMPPPFLSDEVAEAMVVIEPEPEHESFATEPKAVSRESAHGGRDAVDAEIDAWDEDAAAAEGDVDLDTPVATAGTEPALDPGTARAILKESEILRKAADPDKG